MLWGPGGQITNLPRLLLFLPFREKEKTPNPGVVAVLAATTPFHT